MDNEMMTSDLYLKGHRTLTTVVFTDCVGFSARMSVDEEHTFDLIRRDLKLMKSLCEQFEGRVLKTTGDGLLMCFSSAVKAVECAVEIQRAIAEAATKLSPHDSLLHRIGIHLADMYITKTDVMGNGVNIAARLQTEADPGGICISQTVYDVAKHGLQLRTQYLGPRELKNIREVVPAYKVLLEAESFKDDPYAEAAYSLEQSPNLIRIKKLLFYVCKNRWEGDQRTVDALSLRALLQEFLGFASTYDQLKGLLDAAVGTLSKRIEYSAIASEILNQADRFYASTHNPYAPPGPKGFASQPVHADTLQQDLTSPLQFQSSSLEQIYEQIAQALEQHGVEDFTRIKKLLFYICKGQWESDQTRLGEIRTLDLVRDLHYRVPDSGQLTSLVDRFVQTLNKQAEYSLVANLMMRDLGKIYPDLPVPSLDEIDLNQVGIVESVSHPLSDLDVSISSVEQAQCYQQIATELDTNPDGLRIKKLIAYVCRSQWLSDSAQLAALSTITLVEELHRLAPETLNELERAFESVVKTLSKRAEYTAIASTIVQHMRRLYLAEEDLAEKEESPEPAWQPDPNSASLSELEPESNKVVVEEDRDRQHAVNLFDVRLGIMKYANPLRAKILLFSSLHPDFVFSYQDWFDLRQYELDGLLKEVLQTCTTYTELELLLYNTAKRLRDSDELVQTADAVIKCLRSAYLNSRPLLNSAESAESIDTSRINLDDFEQATQRLAIAEDTYDDTHQLYPSSLELDTVLESATQTEKKSSLFPAE